MFWLFLLTRVLTSLDNIIYSPRSPAFGELSDTHFFRFLVGSREDRKAMWGEAPMAPEEIFETFAAYIEGKIPKLVS